MKTHIVSDSGSAKEERMSEKKAKRKKNNIVREDCGKYENKSQTKPHTKPNQTEQSKVHHKAYIYEQLKTDVRIQRNIQFWAHLIYVHIQQGIAQQNNIQQQQQQQ